MATDEPREAQQNIGVLVRLGTLVATFTFSVCLISWPGFMSFDSMYALRQARTGIETGGYPPMVSYLWTLCEVLVPGQGGMFIVQNALVFLGVAALGRAIGAGEMRIALAMLLLACAPVTLGSMLVVWKDVSFAGLMALAYAFTLRYVERRQRAPLSLALLFLFLASSFRLNGIAAALPALAVIAWTIGNASTPWSGPDASHADAKAGWRKQLAASLLFLGLTASTFGFVTLTATWRLPDFGRIPMATGSGWTQVGDLIGISLCAGRNLLPPSFYSGSMTLARLEQIYHPEHSQRSFGSPPLLQESGFAGNDRLVDAAATTARKEHLSCYLQHRARVFLHTMGANAGSVFYLTQADVFPGESGTELKPSVLTARAVSYIQHHDSSWFARSAFFALLAIGALSAAGLCADRSRPRKALLPVAGALTYLIASFFVLPAADARYNFWANLVFMVTFCCVLPGVAAKRIIAWP